VIKFQGKVNGFRESMWPYECENNFSYLQNGTYEREGITHERDIIKILPLPKKKAVKKQKPLDYSLKLMSKSKVRESIAQLKSAIKLLEGLLK